MWDWEGRREGKKKRSRKKGVIYRDGKLSRRRPLCSLARLEQGPVSVAVVVFTIMISKTLLRSKKEKKRREKELKEEE